MFITLAPVLRFYFFLWRSYLDLDRWSWWWRRCRCLSVLSLPADAGSPSRDRGGLPGKQMLYFYVWPLNFVINSSLSQDHEVIFYVRPLNFVINSSLLQKHEGLPKTNIEQIIINLLSYFLRSTIRLCSMFKVRHVIGALIMT